jgi:hypothetical protein
MRKVSRFIKIGPPQRILGQPALLVAPEAGAGATRLEAIPMLVEVESDGPVRFIGIPDEEQIAFIGSGGSEHCCQGGAGLK